MGAAIPGKIKDLHDQIAGLIVEFCRQRLNDEYRDVCLRMLGVLARKRPSPLVNGKANAWACGIVRAVGIVNFLDDRSQNPHVRSEEIDAFFGVSTATGQARSKKIRDLLKAGRMDPAWTLPSRMERNPLAWMVDYQGFIVDVRMLPRQVQEEALRRGMIPYLPEEGKGREKG